MRITATLAASVLIAAFALPLQAQDAKPDAASHPAGVCSCMLVIGASVSDGVRNFARNPQYRLSNHLDAVVKAEHKPCVNIADALLFTSPEPVAKKQIEKIAAHNPTVVIGLDFPFWFLYGTIPTEEKRLEFFEKGLALLEKIDVPLVIGDIPDASAAAGRMLSKNQVPKPETIAAANKRLAEWATARKVVAIVSLSTFMAKCIANEPYKIHDWTQPESRRLLQGDKLHPARHGCTALALEAIAALQKIGQPVPKDAIRTDLEEAYTIALKAGAPPTPSKTPATAPAN